MRTLKRAQVGQRGRPIQWTYTGCEEATTRNNGQTQAGYDIMWKGCATSAEGHLFGILPECGETRSTRRIPYTGGRTECVYSSIIITLSESTRMGGVSRTCDDNEGIHERGECVIILTIHTYR